MYSVKPVGLVLSDLLICPWMHHRNVAGSVLPTHDTQQRVHQQSWKTKHNRKIPERQVSSEQTESSRPFLFHRATLHLQLFKSWFKTLSESVRKKKRSQIYDSVGHAEAFCALCYILRDTFSNGVQHKLFKYFFWQKSEFWFQFPCAASARTRVLQNWRKRTSEATPVWSPTCLCS